MTTWWIISGVAVICLVLLLRRIPALAHALPVWVATAVAGAVIGGGITLAAMHCLGYHWDRWDPASYWQSRDVPSADGD